MLLIVFQYVKQGYTVLAAYQLIGFHNAKALKKSRDRQGVCAYAHALWPCTMPALFVATGLCLAHDEACSTHVTFLYPDSQTSPELAVWILAHHRSFLD